MLKKKNHLKGLLLFELYNIKCECIVLLSFFGMQLKKCWLFYMQMHRKVYKYFYDIYLYTDISPWHSSSIWTHALAFNVCVQISLIYHLFHNYLYTFRQIRICKVEEQVQYRFLQHVIECKVEDFDL